MFPYIWVHLWLGVQAGRSRLVWSASVVVDFLLDIRPLAGVSTVVVVAVDPVCVFPLVIFAQVPKNVHNHWMPSTIRK